MMPAAFYITLFLLASAGVCVRSSSPFLRQRRLPVSDLSDNFDNADDFSLWTNNFPGFISSATVSGGSLTLIPTDTSTFGWYASGNGLFLSKEISPGNFVVEASLSVSSMSGADPAGDWQSAGLMIRSVANGEDFAQVNVGRQGGCCGFPRTWGTQAMSTNNGGSTFNYVEGPSLSGRLRICRIGNDIALMRNLDDDESWQMLEYQQGAGAPFTRADLATGDVQVGMIMSRWTNTADNVQASFDYVQFAEPGGIDDCYVEDLDLLSTPAPVNPTPAPAVPTLAPVTPTLAPITPTLSPTDSTPAPIAPTPSPVETTHAPVETTPAPLTPTPSPVEPTPSPDEPTPAPVEPTPALVDPTFAPAVTPTTSALETLSDEFFYPDSINDWTDTYPERYDSLTIQDGILSIVPSGPVFENVWYDDMHGSMLSKRLSVAAGNINNFVVETLVSVRVGSDSLPTGNWHVGGLIVRSVDDESDWVVLNIGLQGPSGRMGLVQTMGVEAKTTTNNYSEFNYSPAITSSTFSGRLRICHVGMEFLFLHMLEGTNEWTVISPFPEDNASPGPILRDDILGDVDVGIMTNNMITPDDGFTARFDYIRFGSVNTMNDCTGAMSVL